LWGSPLAQKEKYQGRKKTCDKRLNEEDAVGWKCDSVRNNEHTGFCTETPWRLTIGK
jgi:hypothetical protein